MEKQNEELKNRVRVLEAQAMLFLKAIDELKGILKEKTFKFVQSSESRVSVLEKEELREKNRGLLVKLEKNKYRFVHLIRETERLERENSDLKRGGSQEKKQVKKDEQKGAFVENKKRYHAEMHSAEHIVTRVMKQMFKEEGIAHIGSKIEKKKSKCDFKFGRNLTGEERELITKQTNEMIGKGLKVVERVVSIEEAQKIGEKNDFVVNLNRIKGKTVRLVDVGGFDIQCCSGVHVGNTTEIGAFKLTTSDFIKEKGMLRIRYMLKL